MQSKRHLRVMASGVLLIGSCSSGLAVTRAGASRQRRASRRAGSRGQRSGQDARRPARPRKVQGHDQRTDAVWRSPPGHGPQPRGRSTGSRRSSRATAARNTERIKYDYQPPAGRGTGAGGRAGAAGGGCRTRSRAPRREADSAAAGADAPVRAAARSSATARRPASTTIPTPSRTSSCASSTRSRRTPGPARAGLSARRSARRRPDEMYIVGGHMDGIGWGEAANDDGSGTALVMELARIFSSPDVQTERSIRFALWNNEETGLNGARAYVEQRKDLQGKEDPPGSRRLSRTEMARHDPARHDDVRPRHAGPRRQGQPRAAA